LNAVVESSVLATKLKQAKAEVESTDSLPSEIVFKPSDNLPRIWCNPLYLEQAINNMLDNSLEAIEEVKVLMKAGDLPPQENYRGKIVIATGVENERVFLKIQDNGIGIRSENVKDMFTPFFTTKGTGRYSKKGHGIGTYVIQIVMEKHQAKLRIADTAYGKGTTFLIEFPLRAISDKEP
jgi:signal transduction histidine kinase